MRRLTRTETPTVALVGDGVLLLADGRRLETAKGPEVTAAGPRNPRA